MVYGVSGSAKTTLIGLAASYEEFAPMYFMDFDLRVTSLRARLPKEVMNQIYFDAFRDDKIQGAAFTAAQAVAVNPDGLDAKYGVKFKSLVLDSGTFCLKSIMNRVLFLDGAKPSTQTPQLQNYMQQMSLMEELVSKLCGSGRHFFMTCHEATDKDEMSGRLFKAVDLTGKMANRIPGYFNEFWHTEVKQVTGQEPQYAVRTRSDLIYSARTTFRSLETVEAQDKVWPKIVKEFRDNEATKAA